MADICEVDTHISKRYDVKKRLGKGVSFLFSTCCLPRLAMSVCLFTQSYFFFFDKS